MHIYNAIMPSIQMRLARFSIYFVFYIALSLLSFFPSFLFSAIPLHKPYAIVLLGVPGSGRNTLTIKLAHSLEIPCISCANLVLFSANTDSDIGKQSRYYIGTKQPLPDALITQLIHKRITERDCIRGFLIDGFPKTKAQVLELKKTLDPRYLFLPIFIKTTDEWLFQIQQEQKICTQCGKVRYSNSSSEALYTTPINKNEVDDICIYCSNSLLNENSRLLDMLRYEADKYTDQMIEMVHYLKDNALLYEIDGNCVLEVMAQEIRSIIENAQTQAKQNERLPFEDAL